MKARVISFISGIIIMIILGLYAYNKCEQSGTDITNTELSALPADQLFVPIHADTLDFYLNHFFKKGQLYTKKQGQQFVIGYNPQSLILLHANNNKMTEAKKILYTAQKEGFFIKEGKDKVQITMRKKGNYVDCPALIVAEILRKLNEH